MNNKNDRAINFVRFFFLGLAIALLILFGVLVFSIYRSSTREITDSGLVIVDDTEAITQEELTEQLTEELTEAQTEEAAEDLTETDASAAGADETDDDTDSDPDPTADAAVTADGAAAAETAAQTAETSGQSSDSSTDTSALQTVEGDVVVIDDGTATSDDSSSESTGVYSTLNAACNFRSEAGYEDDDGNDTTISSVQAGTQVEVLEAVGGWTKVKIDGVVGYVGAQFVGDSDSDSDSE